MALRRPRPSIRARLTLAAVAVTIVVLAVASITLVAIQRRTLTDSLDEALRQTADDTHLVDTTTAQLPGGDPEDTFTQVIGRDGAVVTASPNVGTDPVVAVQPGDVNRTSIRESDIARPAGRFRLLLRPVDIDGDRHVLVVGRNVDDVDDSVQALITALAIVAPTLVALLGGLAWWLTGRALRPVDAIGREVQDITGTELYRRVPVPDTDDEIADLARTMNAMLERVEAASRRQQQFVDDASHELRTPLTRMITELDVALAHPDHEPPSVTLQHLHDDAADLRRLLEDLLYLARITESGSAPSTEVDLDDVALRAAANARAGSNLVIDSSGISAAPACGDANALARAVDNLLSNAKRHARTSVKVTTRTDGTRSEIVIDDDGLGVPPGDRERVFDRFTRLDEARSRDQGGAGLGLPIAREIVSRHGGTVTISDSPIGGARVTISLPASGVATPPLPSRGTDSPDGS